VARGLEAPVPKAATNFETNNTQEKKKKIGLYIVMCNGVE
jgi:hypothetical protein